MLSVATLDLSCFSCLEDTRSFETIDGQFVSGQEAEAALRSGLAVLIGGLLVGVFASPSSPSAAQYAPARHHLSAAA